MENNVKTLPAEELLPQLLALLSHTEAIPLTVTGRSMTPFLQPGRDTVYLKKPVAPVKTGDVVLYKRKNGQYILHRVYRAAPQELQLIGDGQTGIEPGISPDSVLAVVTAVRRKGKLLQPGHPVWFFYEKLWIRMIPLRPRLRGLMRRLKGK